MRLERRQEPENLLRKDDGKRRQEGLLKASEKIRLACANSFRAGAVIEFENNAALAAVIFFKC